jgi:hypothetical protein
MKQPPESPAEDPSAGNASVRLPRSYLVLLILAAATIALTLGYELAPAIQAKLKSSGQGTVLASSPIPGARDSSAQSAPSVATANLEQLQQMAEGGDSAAQNALGLRYATGEGVKQDESEAVRWFTKAAEQGNVGAQSKLGALYWRGREIPQNVNQAYFWMVLARAGGDDASTAQIPFVRNRMTREQTRAIEQEANNWLQQRQSPLKPEAGR